MSQRNVEQVIGRLVTDEGFRRRFEADPKVALRNLTDSGTELTGFELGALAAIDARTLARIADTIDPRLQKSDLRREER